MYSQAELASLRTSVWKRAKGSLKIRMHNLVRDLAIQIGIKEAPLRICDRNNTMITRRRMYNLLGDELDLRGNRVDDACPALRRLGIQKFRGLKLLAVQSPNFLKLSTSVSGDLIWFRFSGDDLISSIPPTLSLRYLRVLEVHCVSPQDFCDLVGDREPPSQPRELTVVCKRKYKMFGQWTTGPFIPAFPKLGPLPKVRLASKATNFVPSLFPSATSNSLQPPSKTEGWFQAWLGKVNFKNLGKIVLQNILNMETLPINFEEAINLRHVDLSGCKDLMVLPHSFTEKLLQLQYLALTGCRKLVLPSLGKISTLEYLDCDGCSMLTKLPTGTEAQKSLKYLNALRTELGQLPHNLKQLETLEELLIGSPYLTELPSSLCTLSSLTDLILFGCTKLLSIDNSIEKLVNLERLRIYECGVKTVPERIPFTNMKTLDVQDCQMYLHHLKIGEVSGNMAGGSSQNLPRCLTDMIIRGSHITGIHITEAESLFPKLEIIDLSSNIYLTELGRLPSSLINLKLVNCSELTTLGDISNLAGLGVLDISGCVKLTTLVGLSNLAGLKVLDISGCVKLRTLHMEGLTSIEVIKAKGSPNMQIIRGPTLLQKLSYLQTSVASFVSIMTCAPNISTAILSGSTTKMEDIDEMRKQDAVARRFKGIKVRRISQSNQWEGNVKPKGAILLYLIADQNSNIKVTFCGHVYKLHSSSFNLPAHLLFWTEESEVYKDYKSSIQAVNCSLKGRVQTGWMVEAKDSVTCKEILSHLVLNFNT